VVGRLGPQKIPMFCGRPGFNVWAEMAVVTTEKPTGTDREQNVAIRPPTSQPGSGFAASAFALRALKGEGFSKIFRLIGKKGSVG